MRNDRQESLTFKVFSAKLWLGEESHMRECKKQAFSAKDVESGKDYGYQQYIK